MSKTKYRCTFGKWQKTQTLIITGEKATLNDMEALIKNKWPKAKSSRYSDWENDLMSLEVVLGWQDCTEKEAEKLKAKAAKKAALEAEQKAAKARRKAAQLARDLKAAKALLAKFGALDIKE